MSVEDESKIKFIPDITEDFNHCVGNALTEVSAIHEREGAYSEMSEEQSDEIISRAKADFLVRIDELLSSEFNETAKLTKASIRQFRDVAEKIDWNDPERFTHIVILFNRLRKPRVKEADEETGEKAA